MMRPLKLLVFTLLWATDAFADEEKQRLAFAYYHYPPNMLVKEDLPSGHYIDEVTHIADSAGFAVEWFGSSLEEEASMLDVGRRKFCTTGRNYTQARAEKWEFLPYVFDILPADILITSPENTAYFNSAATIENIFSDSSLRAALLENYVFGPRVDNALARARITIQSGGKTDFRNLMLVLAGRVDFTIVPEDQWIAAVEHEPALAALKVFKNLGTQAENPIYIACSKAVSSLTLSKLVQTMAKLGFKKAPFHSDNASKASKADNFRKTQ